MAYNHKALVLLCDTLGYYSTAQHRDAFFGGFEK